METRDDEVGKVRFGLIGTGPACQNMHISNLNLIPEAEIVALYNRGKKNLDEAKKMLPTNPLTFESWEDIVELADVDAVLVTLPPHLNRDIVVSALRKGKHVFCEKPLSNTLEGCVDIVNAAEKSGKILQVGLQLRYSNLYSKVREIIDKEKIGNPQMFWFRSFSAVSWAYRLNTWITDPVLSGGVMNSWAVHTFVILNDLAGADPVSVYSAGGVNVRKETPYNADNAWIVISYANRTNGCLEFCRFSPYGNDWAQIGVIADRGKIEALWSARTLAWFGAQDSTEYRVKLAPYKFSGFDGNYQQLCAFIESVKTGKTPVVDGRTALVTTAVALAAEKSMKEQRAIKTKI